MQCCGSALVECGSGSGPRVLMTENFKKFADEQKFIFFWIKISKRENKNVKSIARHVLTKGFPMISLSDCC
jgi:hypothetical protein